MKFAVAFVALAACVSALATLVATTTAAAAAAALEPVQAHLLDNQLDGRLPVSRYTQAARRGARYEEKTCSPCGADECQVMGMQRFSEPRCEARGGLGAPCRMWQEPENKTLSFPNMLLSCNDVYMQFCPCARGLVCDEAECKRPARRSLPTGPLERREREDGPDSADETSTADESANVSTNTEAEDENENESEMPVAFEPAQSRFPWAVARFH